MTKFRTPIIKPRTQGGTFYTFGSAMEDIGLNISGSNNKVELSHYILLDIPDFDADSLSVNEEYYSDIKKKGDYIFADFFQNAILNMETVLRNTDDYNYASSKTVSERVFWKWLFKNSSSHPEPDEDTGYYYDDSSTAIAKAFGNIVSGSHRVDSYGIYNETFVQIPSSYGRMRVLFKRVEDENYKLNVDYESSNDRYIEGIDSSTDIDPSTGTLIATGISSYGIFDEDYKYLSTEDKDVFEAELSIEKLREYYDDDNLTIDDIGFGNIGEGSDLNTSFKFNAILVYYSIYDSTGEHTLSTNAFGLYILDNAINVGDDDPENVSESGKYRFPELTKDKTTNKNTGTSFSFRINIKPTSAYSGDITIGDNSTTAFSESEDFNDVVKNLSKSIEIMKSNARYLSEISENDQKIKSLAMDAIDKVTDLDKTVKEMKDSSIYDAIAVNDLYTQSFEGNVAIDSGFAKEILNKITVKCDENQKISIAINTDFDDDAKSAMANSLTKTIGGRTYWDTTKLVALLVASLKS